MPDDLLRPEDDTDPPGDPVEADLVAYLDGELDPAAARAVEARLAADPRARARAAELKKAFDLLDFLPRPEPSSAFTSRTLEKIPALAGAVAPAAAAATPVPVQTLPSTSVPVLLDAGPVYVPAPAPPAAPARSARGWWAVGVLLAAAAFAAGGYLVPAVFRPAAPEPPRAAAPDEPEPPPSRVIESLPLYAAADDLGFVRELDHPDLFGAEPAVAFDPGLMPPALPATKPSGAEYDALLAAYKAMPPARQAAARDLDRDLFALDARDRDRLNRVLEAYAVWLDRLPPADRGAVLGAATREDRLGVVRRVRDRQWVAALPPGQRAVLARMTDEKERQDAIRRWRADPAARWEELGAGPRVAWPFDTEAGRKEVIAFARVALRPDEPEKSRLTPVERERYAAALAAAAEKGGGAWHAFGREVYSLTRKYERDIAADLARGLAAGVAEPTRPDQFREPLRGFLVKELMPKLRVWEQGQLTRADGTTEYAKQVLLLSRQYDLSAPGLMLPFSPAQWDGAYGRPPRP